MATLTESHMSKTRMLIGGISGILVCFPSFPTAMLLSTPRQYNNKGFLLLFFFCSFLIVFFSFSFRCLHSAIHPSDKHHYRPCLFVSYFPRIYPTDPSRHSVHYLGITNCHLPFAIPFYFTVLRRLHFRAFNAVQFCVISKWVKSLEFVKSRFQFLISNSKKSSQCHFLFGSSTTRSEYFLW